MSYPGTLEQRGSAPRFGTLPPSGGSERVSRLTNLAAERGERELRPESQIVFLANGKELQFGDVVQGGWLRIDYAPERRTDQDHVNTSDALKHTRAHVRFHPAGQMSSADLVQRPGREGEERFLPVPLLIRVPPDAEAAEMWFERTDVFGDVTWDTHGGRNYWFEVCRAGPLDRVRPRLGAIQSPGMIRLAGSRLRASELVVPMPGPSGRVDYQSALSVVAWVKNIAFAKNVWIDLHIFDGHDVLLESKTCPLSYESSQADGGDLFTFQECVFRGAVGNPRLAMKPRAQKVQFRLYFEVNGQVLTDGYLHQVETD